MPKLNSILETALYVDDLHRAAAFYEGVLGLSDILHADDRMRAYGIEGRSVLLLFRRGGTLEPVRTGGGIIPPHDGRGPLHIAFAIAPADLPVWEAHLAENGIEIESTTDWSRGGHSLYFRDPDSNLVEIATSPGLWRGF